jgi:hypothetical protein
MNKLKPVLILAVIVVALVVILRYVMQSVNFMDNFTDEVRVITTPNTTFDSGPVILDAIRTQAKLETVAMAFVNDQEVSKEWGLEVVGEVTCWESITYLGYYTVTAGVDLHEITPADIQITNDEVLGTPSITITLPTAKIMHVEPDNQRSRVLDDDVSIISQLCGTKLPEMVLEAQVKIDEYSKNAALQKDILSMAQEKAGFELQQLLFNLGYPNVFIQYHASE